MSDETNMNSSIAPEENTYDQTISSTPESSPNEGFSGFYGFGDVQTDRSAFGKEAIQINDYVMNATDPNSYYNAAVNQGVWSALGSGLGRGIFGEIIGGTIAGFGALANVMVDGEYSERNFMEQVGQHMMDTANEEYAIFERNRGAAFQFGDAAWWAKNMPSMMSTISMMIPGMAVSKGASLAGKAARRAARGLGAKAGSKIGDVVELGAQNLAGAMAMRHAENMREAHDSYETARQDFLSHSQPLDQYKGTDAWRAFVRDNGRKPVNSFELADYMGGVAAKKSYQFNSANLAFDFMQMTALGKALRGTRGALKGTKAAAALGKEVTRADKFIERGLGFAKFAVMDAGTEGVEELVNYMGSEEGRYLAKLMAGHTAETTFEQRFQEYAADDHFWEAGFLGAIGGAVFTGAGKAGGAINDYRARTEGQKSLEDRVKQRGQAVKAAADIANAAAQAETPEQRQAIDKAVEGQLFNIGAQAAAEGTADLAEQQIQVALMEMEAAGVPEAEQNERVEKMRAAFKAGEEAVAATRREARALGLSEEDAAAYSTMAMNIRNNMHQNQAVLPMIQEMTKDIPNRAEQLAALDRNALKVVRDANNKLRAEGKQVDKRQQILEDLLAERVGDSALATEEEVAALREEKAALQAKKDERTEEENARLQEIVEQLSDLEDAQNMKVHGAIKDEHNLLMSVEGGKRLLTHLQSEEGRAMISEAAAAHKKNEEKREAKAFNDYLAKASEDMLKADLKKEKDPAKREAIEKRLQQLETERKNEANAETAERSKDIAIPGPVQAQVDELLNNTNRVQLNEDGTYYVDADGNKYQRATTFMNGGKETQIPDQWGIPSSNIGNSVDEYVRDFFNGSLREPAAYPHLPAELQQMLSEQLQAIEEQFLANGEKVIAKDVVLFQETETNDPEAIGVAGTVDLLTVDKDGNFRIYDMKTIRNAVDGGKVKIDKDGNATYGAKGRDLQSKHQKQLSTYRLMLQNQLGAEVVGLGIIPIDVMYTPTAKMSKEQLQQIVTDRANLLPILTHDALAEVESLEEAPATSTDEIVPEDTQESEVEQAEEPTADTEAQHEEAPVTTEVLEGDAVSLPLTALVNYFGTRLQVVTEPGRERHFLVHGHDGAVVIGDQTTANAYDLMVRALNGDTTVPVTMEVTTSGQTVEEVNVWTRLQNNPAADLLDEVDSKGNYKFRPGTGDSLVVQIKIGGVVVGTLPTTAELMQAAHERGQANLSKYAAKQFGTESRVGAVRGRENLLMSEVSQEAHLQNAVAMHALRQKLYEMQKNGEPIAISVNLGTAVNSFGQAAQGSLIYDTSGEVTPESVGADAAIRKHGIALQLPSAKEGGMQLEVSDGMGTVVTPYQQGETRAGNVSADSVANWTSGALFVPLEHGGEVLWVKVPGQTISQLNSAETLVPAIINVLNAAQDGEMTELQNILGSRALRKDEKGRWAIYPTNQRRRSGDKPLSVLRNGSWTTPIESIVPGMAFDIAATTEDGSAFQNPDFIITIGSEQYNGIADFVAREIKLGYAPVIANGEVLGWTHPMAPAYPFNDNGRNSKFSNENTKATQLTVTATPVGKVEGPKKVSGKAALDALLEGKKQQGENNLEGVDTSWMDDAYGDEDTVWWMSTAAAAGARNTDKATKEDMEQAEKWWAENMPHVPFKRVKGIISRNGRTGYGIFEAGAVQVSDLAIVGTEYHEAFHAVMEMYLTPARREKVLAEAAKLTGKTDEETNHEYLAEEFREYMLTKGLSNREKSTIRRFFSELLELIQALATGRFSQTRVFQQINKGEFATRPTQKTISYATRNKLIMADIPEYDVKVQKELNDAFRSNMFQALRIAQRGQGGPKFQEAYARIKELIAMSNAEFREEVGPGITREQAITRKMLELALNGPMKFQAMQILKHSPDAADMSQRFKDLFSTNKEQVLDFFMARPEMVAYTKALISQEFTAGTDTNVQYEESFEKMNPKDSLSQTVKSLIETTPLMSLEVYKQSPEVKTLMAAAQIHLQEGENAKAAAALSRINDIVGQSATKSYFGLPQMMSVDKVFPFMSERMAHLATPQAMIEELYEMGQVYPEFALLAMRLLNEDTATQAQFFAAMRRGSTAELIMKRGSLQVNDVFEGTLFTHNRGNLEVALRDMAQSRGEEVADTAKKVAVGAANAAIKSKDMSDEQFIKVAKNVLGAIGFSTVDPVALDRVLELRAGDPQFREQLLRNASAVAQTYAAYVAAAEAQQGQANKKVNRNMQVLVEKFAKYDMGAVGTTFTNVEGSRIYGKQVPSYITEYFDQFEVNGRSPEMIEEQLRNEMFRDKRMFATNFGKILFPAGEQGKLNIKALHAMRTFRLGGIDAMGGVTYTNMTDEQWYQTILTAIDKKTYVNGTGMHYLPITTPSDASNTYMVPAVVYNLSTPAGIHKAKMHLRETIEAEFTELKQRSGRFSIAPVDALMREKLVRDGDGAFYKVTDMTIPQEVLDEATEVAFAALMKEGQAAMKMETFSNAMDAVKASSEEVTAEEKLLLAQQFAVATYLSNFSTAVALSGTANEFKKKANGNTVDMQKRHKHIMSPGVANAGVTGRQTFRSVTMKEATLDLTKFADYLPAAYTSVDVADAQSWVSIDFYRDILEEHGDLTPEVAEAIDKIKRGETLDKAEVKLLRPYKPFYYSRTFNENTGLLESQQIKNSIIPIIPGISKDLDKFAAWMKENKIDQVQMNSAHKVGQTRNQVELRGENGEFVGGKVNEADIYTLPMTGYRKQVNVTDHWHNDSTNKLASQLEKIVSAAARRGGKDELAGKFIDTLAEIYQDQMAKVLAEFTTDGQVDINKMQDWLIGQLDDGTTPQATIELIRKGMFTAPTVIGAVRSRIFTKMENEVNTIRVAGGTQVQVSSLFFRGTENRLRGMRLEDGVVKPAEIAVSRDFLPKEYRNMSIEEIREAAPEVLKSITLRIPSEAMNSGAVVEVVEFLPEGMDGVIVPDEFVTQMGSDFDVDKLFFQFRANDGSKQDQLFDMMVEVFETPAMLEQIMAPQGFDTFSAKAKAKPLRSAKQEEFIAANPYSGVTHAMLRSDNMAGVTLKGQAANKNVILLDLIRYGWKWSSADFKINNKPVQFDGLAVSQKLVQLQAEAVAAAMDGAKDPVYGKLGINMANFGLFSELLMMTDGDIDFALSIIQSEAVQLESNGHIIIRKSGKKTVDVQALTDTGLKYVMKINKGQGAKAAPSDQVVASKTVVLATNNNFFTPKGAIDAKSEMFLAAAIGTWKGDVSKVVSHVSSIMRSDKVNVAKGIEGQLLRTSASDKKIDGGTVNLPGKDPIAIDGEVPVKEDMHQMFFLTARMLSKLGDAYLELKNDRKMDPMGQGMTMQQFDMYKSAQAAAKYSLQSTYTAMGERTSRTPEALPEDRGLWSLEMWIRHFRANEEALANPDVALIMSKLLVSNNPYNVRGTYFDNITLVGVNDEGELKQITEAMDRLDASDDIDMHDFIEAMEAYEAQRSRYGTSQGRLTRILPTQVQMDIAEAAGASGVIDVMTDVPSRDIIAMDVHNPNVPFIAGETVMEAMQNAEARRKAQVYRMASGNLLLPYGYLEDGTILFTEVESPNAGLKFAGKDINAGDAFAAAEKADESRWSNEITEEDGEFDYDDAAFSVLGYRPEMDADAKIQLLQNRFASMGIKVTVKFDSSLPANGAVKIDKATATVFLHPDKLQGDTIAHEFGHILLEALGYEHELVQQAIAELRGSDLWNAVREAYPDLSERDLAMEVVVTAVGRKGSELFEDAKKTTKIKGIINRILRAIGKLFGITPKAVDQLAQELMYGDGKFSLEAKLEVYAEQRRKGDAKATSIEASKQLRDRLNYLRQIGGTSAEAQAAMDKTEGTLRAVSRGKLMDRMNALVDAVDDTLQAAGIITDTLERDAIKYRNTAHMDNAQALQLQQAHDMINQLDTFLRILDTMAPLRNEEGVELTDTEKAFAAAQERFDEVNEMRNQLVAATKGAVSNKLLANSTNDFLKDNIGEDLIFDLYDNRELRELMTDVDSVSAGALGLKEFRNPVIQNITKLMQDTLEAARLEGKQDEAKIEAILKNYEGDIDDLIDFETGTFKGEFNGQYYVEREKVARKAAQENNPELLTKWDAENSINEYTEEYMVEYLVGARDVQRLQDKLRWMEYNGKKGSQEYKDTYRQLHEAQRKAKEVIAKFHNIEVLDGFEVAAAEARAKTTAAKERMAEVGYDGLTDQEIINLHAEKNFIDNHGVIDGQPTMGQYVVQEVKDEYKNPEYTGKPQPKAKWQNAAWASTPENTKQTITELKKVMAEAAGTHGAAFIEAGFVPAYVSQAGKSATEQVKANLKGKKEAVGEAAGMVTGTNKKNYSSEVAQSETGGRIYKRNAKVFAAASEEAIEALGKNKNNVKEHLKQFVKDARTEAAKRDLEPMAYLTREFFNESKIIDGSHTFRIGKKQTRTQAFKMARGSNVAEALDQWYEGILGDNWEDSSAMDGFARIWQSYTSLMGVGLNPNAWINNAAYGTLQLRMENMGGRYYSKEQSRAAHKILRGEATSIMADIARGARSYDSVASAMIHTYDIADDQRELPFTQKETRMDKMMSAAFVGQTFGEIMMQNQLFFAMMLNTVVELADGTVTNLYEAHTLEDGQLKLPEGAKVADHNGEMVELNNNFMAAFRNKVKSINHHVHGAYNKADSGTWQRHWLGRVGMQFRRWLPMGIKKRFGQRMYNESRYRMEIGDYRALRDILAKIFQDAKTAGGYKQAYEAIKEADPLVYEHAKRALKEIGIGIGIFLATAAIYMVAGIDDEDELSWGAAVALNRAERLQSEMFTYTPMGIFEFIGQVKKDPIASLSKMEDMGDFIWFAGHDAWQGITGGDMAVYKSGDHRGQSKLLRSTIGLIPGTSQWRRNVTDLDVNHRAHSWNLATLKALGLI